MSRPLYAPTVVVATGGTMSYNFRYIQGGAEFKMGGDEKQKLVDIARIDRRDMSLLSAEITINENQVQLVKRYQCRYQPHKREMRYVTKPGDDDNNNEIFSEIALIDEQL